MSEKLSDARDFGEFLRILDIPKPIENIDYDDFPLSDVAEMSKLQLMDSFAIDDTAASKIVDGITKLVKKKEPKKEAEQPKRRFKLFKTGTSKKKISFDDVFDDISDTPYHQGDQWTMDACAGAMSASSEEFDEIFDNLTKVSAPDVVANTVNEQGWTPLMYAAAMGRIHIAKVLIEEGANLKAVNNRGQTALMIAASYGHRDFIIQLAQMALELSIGVDLADGIGLHMKDKEKKFTALHYAAYYAQYDALKELVRMGADPNMPDHDDNTPTLLCCVDPAQERCLKYLCQKGGDLKVINADGMDGFMLGQDRPAIHNIYEQVARPSNVKKLRNPRYGAF